MHVAHAAGRRGNVPGRRDRRCRAVRGAGHGRQHARVTRPHHDQVEQKQVDEEPGHAAKALHDEKLVPVLPLAPGGDP